MGRRRKGDGLLGGARGAAPGAAALGHGDLGALTPPPAPRCDARPNVASAFSLRCGPDCLRSSDRNSRAGCFEQPALFFKLEEPARANGRVTPPNAAGGLRSGGATVACSDALMISSGLHVSAVE